MKVEVKEINSFCRVIRELPFFRTLFQIAFLWDIRKQEDCDVSEQTANLPHGFHPSPGSCSMGLGLHCQVPFLLFQNLKKPEVPCGYSKSSFFINPTAGKTNRGLW